MKTWQGFKTGAIYGQRQEREISLVIYLIAIFIALFEPMISCALYATVALIWFMPDRRIEKAMHNELEEE
ncbi:MAG: hypothetical protein ABIO50_06955 [Nitrosospira sp.]